LSSFFHLSHRTTSQKGCFYKNQKIELTLDEWR
jgi:hypothetical protein